MKTSENAPSDKDSDTLREKIKLRYDQYYQRNPKRFPFLDYNTNRANYEPLRNAFEDEFYVSRGLERNSSTLHIPSTNTLMLLFTDTTYVPGRKILNTCWSFAEGPVLVTPPPPPIRKKPTLWVIAILATIVGLGALVWIGRRQVWPEPSGLVIQRPMVNSVVPQEVVVSGSVANAQTVWIVVRSITNRLCWVQPRISVQANGFWLGVIHIGDPGKSDDGYAYEVRAFVDPETQLKWNDVLYDWPEAALSTRAVKVIRGPVDR